MFKYFLLTSLLCLASAGNLDYLPGRQQGHHSSHGSASRGSASAPAAVHASAPAAVDRQFFYFNAPEDDSPAASDALKQFNAATSRKKQQIIFIKPPENRGYEKALQSLVQNAAEPQQTKIYVLQKEPNYAALRQKVQSVQHAARQNSRPDVHFVKYGTPQEAHQAQQSITKQYEVLPGKSSHYNLNARTIDGHSSGRNAPVDKGYAKKFLPSGVDVVPGSSYIPLAAFT